MLTSRCPQRSSSSHRDSPPPRSQIFVSLDKHTSDQVKEIIRELAREGISPVRPEDVLTRMRQLGRPLAAWNMRFEFTRLTREGFLCFDSETARWTLAGKS